MEPLRAAMTSNRGVDDDERDERVAIRADELDPDDPAVVAALDLVRWELALLGDHYRAVRAYR
jgi:hypothetical protein